jgi:hypothetical protein
MVVALLGPWRKHRLFYDLATNQPVHTFSKSLEQHDFNSIQRLRRHIQSLTWTNDRINRSAIITVVQH